MAKINLVVQDSSDRAAAPAIRSGGIQMPVGRAILLVVVIGWVQHFLISENTGDLIRTFSGSAQLKNSLNYRSGILIRNNLFCVIAPLAVAVRRPAAQPLTALGLEFLHCTNFLAGLLGVKFVCPIADRIEISTALHQRIYSIIDGNEPDALAELNEQAQNRCRLIIRQMAAAEGVTEELKRRSQWAWVKAMNSIVDRAEESIKHELIYT